MPMMQPPATGIKVRMYRQGHGDCFLLATKKTDGQPFYMLIDCGLWRGSEINGITIDSIVASIREATNDHLDVVLITHEHEDHVNGFAAQDGGGNSYWDGIHIDEVWLAWTEDETDPDANDLRDRFNDVLLGLVAAVANPSRFQVAADDDRLQMIKDVIALHTGEPDVSAFAGTVAAAPGSAFAVDGAVLAAKIPGVSNKKAMQSVRHRAQKRVRFLSPGKEVYDFESVKGIRVFGLGPPRNTELLLSLEPYADERFKFALDHSALALVQALGAKDDDARAGNPFMPRYGVPVAKLAGDNADFFKKYHGHKDGTDGGPDWRRIDAEWLDAAESLALRLNKEVNNTSLVIAIELPATHKVLLFSGDAQRGSWISWSKLEWQLADNKTVKARDLLARTVLYKVGHHGSHNATLKGRANDDFANLSWLGQSEYGKEFVAMIPAHRTWAYAKKPHAWKHPLASIEEALVEKARGRVFVTDHDGGPDRHPEASDKEWKAFDARKAAEDLYFECDVTDAW